MKNKLLLTFFYISFFAPYMDAQPFTAVENSILPGINLNDYWTGVSWIDVDQDQDIDLFLTNRTPGPIQKRNMLLINQSGQFEYATTGALVTTYGYWFGNTWGDYNNDGLTDVFIAGFPAGLFKNLGNAQFEQVSLGEINASNVTGIGAAFGDLNNDGLLDIVIVRPNWIQAPPTVGQAGQPQILINNGPPNYTFNEFEDSSISQLGDDTYLQPTLSDFDDDGDLDLFISMGSGQPKKDLVFKNLKTETNVFSFEQINNTTLSETLLEGNHWSFEDIDNDGDRDAFVTNWAIAINNETLPRANSLFSNIDNTFAIVNASPLTTDEALTTTACWGDYDNDADLDVITISDSTFTLSYYQNDGTGNFISIDAGALGAIDKHQSGGSVGDYDNDGDLDLFIPGPENNLSLLRNDLNNNYNWVQFLLKGVESNATAIGTKIWLHCTIEGAEIIQHREISSCNTFFGMNSLVQHFGLNTAITIDSLTVIWPTNQTETFYNLAINQLHTLQEGEGGTNNIKEIKAPQYEVKVYPNPIKNQTSIAVLNLEKHNSLRVFLSTLDGQTIKYLGKVEHQNGYMLEIEDQSLESLPTGGYLINFYTSDGGVFSYKIVVE